MVKINKRKLSFITIPLFISFLGYSNASEIISDNGSADEAAAKNNTQAQKMNGSISQVTVNPRTGDLTFDVPMPGFSGLDLTISYSNFMAQSNKAGNSNFFNMPNGVFFKSLPIVHKGNNGRYVLFFSGSDYYTDINYASVDSSGNEYLSGLRYQTSKAFKFRDCSKNPETIIIDSEGSKASLQYSFIVEYANGSKYYLNDKGLCILLSDKYFESGKSNNYKHIVKIDYINNGGLPENNQLKSITNFLGNKITFDYSDAYLTITYPKDASGYSRTVCLQRSGNSLQAVRTSLSSTYDSGFAFNYSGGNLQMVENVLYKSGTFDKASEESYYKVDYTYGKASFVTYSDMKTSNKISSKYNYFGESSSGYSYGEDTMMNLPNVPLNEVEYQSDEEGAGKYKLTSYNYLHMPIDVQSGYISNGSSKHITNEVFTVYPDPIEKGDKRLLRTNYSNPIKNISLIYEEGAPIAISQSITESDDFGNTTSTKNYPAVPYSGAGNNLMEGKLYAGIDIPVYPGGTPITEESTKYDYAYVVPVEKTSKDNTIGSTTVTTSTLTSDKRDVNSELTTVNGKQFGQAITYTYSSDDAAGPAGGNMFSAGLVSTEEANEGGKDVKKLHRYDISNVSPDAYGVVTNTTTRDASDSSSMGNVVTIEKELSINGQTVQTINSIGSSSFTKYDIAGNKIEEVAIDGVRTINEYNYLNRTVQQTLNPKSGSNLVPIVNFKKISDFLGNVIFEYSFSKNKAMESSTIYNYNLGGVPVEKHDPYGNVEKTTYDEQGRPYEKISYINNKGNLVLENYAKITYKNIADNQYGCYLQSVEESNNSGNKGITKTSLIRGEEKGSKDEDGNPKPAVLFSQTVSNTTGKIVEHTESDYTQTGVLTASRQYDEKGKLLKNKTYEYDTAGREHFDRFQGFDPSTGISSERLTNEIIYDGWNIDKVVNKVLTSDKDTKVARDYIKAYDTLGRNNALSYILDGKTYSTSIIYDNADRPRYSTDFNGVTKTSDYDPVTGRLKTETFSKNKNVQKLDENAPFRVAAGYFQNQASNVVSYSYDDYGRLSENGENSDSVGYFYNDIGLRKSIKYNSPSSFLNDGSNGSEESIVTYNSFNDIDTVTRRDGFQERYTYFDDGKVSNVSVYKDNTLVASMTTDYYEYSPSENPQATGKVKKVTSEFNYSGIHNLQVCEYTYDDLGREKSVTYTDEHGGITKVETEYTIKNQIKQQTYTDDSKLKPNDANMNKVVIYTYDALDRLSKSETYVTAKGAGKCQSIVEEYSYDMNGNILQETDTILVQGDIKSKGTLKLYSYNEIDQLTNMSTTPLENNIPIPEKGTKEKFVYDFNGNMIQEIDAKTDKILKKYEFNGLNQMTGFEDCQTNQVYHYGYYPAGNRAWKATQDIDGTSMIKFIYDFQANLVNEELIVNNNLTKRSSYIGPFRYIDEKSMVNN